jgi:4-hydroxythreonine-4-phosphate dehydrogenase
VPGSLCIRPVAAAQPAVPGQPDPRNVPYLLECFERGARGCMADRFDGLVTGPVQKATFNAAGVPFSGVTELLARHAGGCDVVMMLANPDLRVALATTHLPLRAVPDAITADRLARVLRVLDAALRTDFGIAAPRIAVLGLNPHAGEDGHLGREEIEVIGPCLHALRAEGMQLLGPLPADTAFLPHKLRDYDAVLAMYHDQGLPVLKFSGFERAVNITLGLPFVRVAVDHGTALDLAGTGTADPSSLIAAATLAASLGMRRRGLRGLP